MTNFITPASVILAFCNPIRYKPHIIQKNTNFRILFLPTSELVIGYFYIVMYIVLSMALLLWIFLKSIWCLVFHDSQSYVLAQALQKKTLCLTENICHVHWLTCCIDGHNWRSVWCSGADKVMELKSGLLCLTLLIFPWGSIKDTLMDVHGTFSNSKTKPIVAVRSLRCSHVECCYWHFLLSTLVWLFRICL